MKYKKSIWRKATIGVLAAAVGIFIGGCGTAPSTEHSGLSVVTTVYPVYDVAKQVGGDKVQLTLLVPPGSEPHDWEPSANDLKAIGKAKLFLYNGAGLEPTEKLLSKDVLREAKPVELAKAVQLLPMPEEAEEHHEHDEVSANQEAHEHEHAHGPNDPHVWLDPTNVMKEVDVVVKAFSDADPANAAYYKKNGEAYKERLAKLDASYSEWAKGLTQKHIVVTHEAFGYLAHRYGLEQLGIMGIAPDAEPTPERMAQIVAFIKEHKVPAIFSEELVNPKLAEAIAKEAGAEVYVLNPVEGLTEEQTKEGKDYLSLMEENLATLKKALH